jgi:hypothetical protein
MMIGFIKSLFSTDIVGSVERLASEYIETDMESAEAKALMVKTLDPNGKMRRDLSRFACRAYGFYLVSMVVLAFMYSFGIGDPEQSGKAIAMMQELFLPITTAWGGIVGASFGVNATNSIKGS